MSGAANRTARAACDAILATALLWPVVAQGQAEKPACVLGPDAVKPRMETHTLAPYPPGAIANNEQGTVLLEIRIADDGEPTKVRVKTPSGHANLDEATRAWVEAHWKWEPIKKNCIADIFVNYRWNLVRQIAPGP